MRIPLPIDLKADGRGRINGRAVRFVRCKNADVCTVDCPHREPHKPVKLSDGYRCDQYKRKDIERKKCDNIDALSMYCVEINKGID